MKKLMVVLALVAPLAHADILADGALTFGADTRQLTVSTGTASPTQILTNDPYITRTYIVNPSTYTLYVSSTVTISTTTAFGIVGSSVWSPDGPQVPFWGPMYAVLAAGPGQTGQPYPNTISVFRSK